MSRFNGSFAYVEEPFPEKVVLLAERSAHHLDALDSSNSPSCAFLTSLRIRGSLPVETAKMARVTATCTSDLIPMIIPPRGLTVYLCGAPLWSARVNVPKALPFGS